MSEVETPPAQQGRRCPRCGAGLTEHQEWCLHCGAAVGARVVAAPGWRAPIALAGFLLALTAVAATLALVALADDTEQVAQVPPAAASPAPTLAPAPTPTPLPTAVPTPGGTDPLATPTPTPTGTPTPTPDGSSTGIATWPEGESGWTIILASERSRAEAETKAEGFADAGTTGVGLLDTDDFSSLNGGYWAVYSGRYDTRAAAEDALASVDAPDAYVRQVTPR